MSTAEFLWCFSQRSCPKTWISSFKFTSICFRQLHVVKKGLFIKQEHTRQFVCLSWRIIIHRMTENCKQILSLPHTGTLGSYPRIPVVILDPLFLCFKLFSSHVLKCTCTKLWVQNVFLPNEPLWTHQTSPMGLVMPSGWLQYPQCCNVVQQGCKMFINL